MKKRTLFWMLTASVPVILSAVTVPLDIAWVALLVLWKRAPEDGVPVE